MNSEHPSEAQPRGEGGVEAFFPGKGLPKLPEIAPGKLFTTSRPDWKAFSRRDLPESWLGVHTVYNDCYQSGKPKILLACSKPFILEEKSAYMFHLAKGKAPIEGGRYALAFQALVDEHIKCILLDYFFGGKNHPQLDRETLRSTFSLLKEESLPQTA